MKKIRLFALVMLGLMTSVAFAQNLRVTGVVTSEEDGQPLPGAIVTVKGTTQGTGTVADGSYTLNNVPANAVLEFRYTGMKSQEVSVGGKSKIDVVMKVDALQAEEAVVTALGVRKQERKVGYSVSTVGGDEIARGSQTNVVAALQGKVAGVQINSSSVSGVTNASNIVIRGAKSLTKSAQPIFVVDGIILENAEGSRGSNGTTDATQWGNQIKELNPDDFESVTILKGAAATSLYGSRGANGAVVINTKKGKARKGIGLEVNYSHTFGQNYGTPFAENTVRGLGDWYNTGTEGNYNPNWESTINGYFDWAYGPTYESMKGQQMKLWYNGDDTYSDYVYHSNYKSFFRESAADNISAALTGGSDKVTYRLSYGYNHSQGNYETNRFKRHTVDFTTTGQINDILSVDFALKYANSQTDNAQSYSGWDVSTSPSMLLGYYANPTADAAWYKDNWIDPDTYEVLQTGLGGWTNYFARMLNNNSSRYEQSIITRLQLNAKFTEWLDASAGISYNYYNIFQENKNYGTGINRASGGSYSISGNNTGNYDGTAQIHYNDRFINDNFEVDARVMAEIYGNQRGYSMSKSTNGGLIAPGVFSFSNSKNALTVSNVGAGQSYRNTMTVGVAGIVNLSWKDQINLELTGRNDWLSSLLYPTYLPNGADNYSIFYPSANVSWIFSDTFHIDPNVVSYGKLRASIARVGMGTSAYTTSSGTGGYSQSQTTIPGRATETTSTIFYANPNNSTLPNYDLKPEVQQSIEFGADVRFLNDAIGLDVTYYKTNTFNQILSLSAASESGVTSRWINAGNIQNQGWEVQIDATPIRTRNWRWNISANWTRNRGKIVELHDEVKSYCFMGYVDPACPEVWAFEGGDYGIMIAGNGYSPWSNPCAYQLDPTKAGYGKRYIGYGTTGGENVAYWMNTGQITSYDPDYWDLYPEGEQYNKIGNVQPDYYWGANTTLSFKGFDLYIQVDGRKGGMCSTPVVRYVTSQGSSVESLQGSDASFGGVARTNYKGETEYNGLILDGVFAEGYQVTDIRTGQKTDVSLMTMQEAVDAGIIEPAYWAACSYYNNRWACNTDVAVQELTYISLREITLGYNFPEKWIKHIGLQSARLQVSCRNVCYLQNNLRLGMNPESLTNMNVMTPYDCCGVPFNRSWYLTLNLRF